MSKTKVDAGLYDILRSPMVTEKAYAMSESQKFVFEVASYASKPSVKKAVEAIFGVSVRNVNIIVSKGKVKMFRGTRGKRKDTKKAVVTLEKGQTLDFETGV